MMKKVSTNIEFSLLGFINTALFLLCISFVLSCSKDSGVKNNEEKTPEDECVEFYLDLSNKEYDSFRNTKESVNLEELRVILVSEGTSSILCNKYFNIHNMGADPSYEGYSSSVSVYPNISRVRLRLTPEIHEALARDEKIGLVLIANESKALNYENDYEYPEFGTTAGSLKAVFTDPNLTPDQLLSSNIVVSEMNNGGAVENRTYAVNNFYSPSPTSKDVYVGHYDECFFESHTFSNHKIYYTLRPSGTTSMNWLSDGNLPFLLYRPYAKVTLFLRDVLMCSDEDQENGTYKLRWTEYGDIHERYAGLDRIEINNFCPFSPLLTGTQCVEEHNVAPLVPTNNPVHFEFRDVRNGKPTGLPPVDRKNVYCLDYPSPSSNNPGKKPLWLNDPDALSKYQIDEYLKDESNETALGILIPLTYKVEFYLPELPTHIVNSTGNAHSPFSMTFYYHVKDLNTGTLIPKHVTFNFTTSFITGKKVTHFSSPQKVHSEMLNNVYANNKCHAKTISRNVHYYALFNPYPQKKSTNSVELIAFIDE